MSSFESQPDRNFPARSTPWVALIGAFQFLTIIPPLIKRPFSAKELGQAVSFYPLVGVGIGSILLGTDYLLLFISPPQLRAALILALWVILTGALHLDGFLDACDGLLGGFTPEHRLQIMRDERIGAFAFSGGVLLLLIKYSALTAIQQPFTALMLAPTLGRWSMVLAIQAFPYARSQGLGREIKDNTNWRIFTLATLITLPIVWISGNFLGLFTLGLITLLTMCISRFCLSRLPGLSGDIYGALNEIVEVIVLLVIVISQAIPGYPPQI